MILSASALALAASYRKELGRLPIGFMKARPSASGRSSAYWPQDDLLITGSVNSRPPNGEDKFGPTVIGGAFMALQQAGLPEGASEPAAE